MVTCRSTTKRTPIAKSSASSTDDSSSSNRRSSAHRRSQSLSYFSRPLPPAGDDLSGVVLLPRGRFVNTIKGSGFPNVTLDDLAIQFFGSADRGRSYSRIDDVSSRDKVSVSQRRGRSMSRGTVRELVKGKLVVEMAMSGDGLIPIIIQGGDALYLLSDIKLVILRQRV
ncbi:uncharacterized protein LOC122723060 [Manihot esculenta]|uniref:uncharacterized protein LOC122723060 n=1 Tax=Manihot esculenta TaxID=3983 RepID=UPI001CC6A4E8|nr:uncharacterized protein LOC122723060 [Manihot esculenta]